MGHRLSLGLLAVLLSLPAMAQTGDDAIGLTGEVRFTTDYLFRGISRSEGRPAVQGRFDYQSERGYYAGILGSSIAHASGLELDYTGGYRHALTDDLQIDLGLDYYSFPGASSQDTLELRLGLDWSSFQLHASRSNDYFGSRSAVNHYRAGYGTELVPNLVFRAHAGLSDADDRIFGARSRYTHYGASLTAHAMNLDVRLGWSATSLDRSDCGATTDCDTTFLLSISRSL